MLVSDMKFHLSTEQGLNRMDARKFTLFNLNEHRVLNRIQTIINKCWNCIFCKMWRGHAPPATPSLEALVIHTERERLKMDFVI